MFGRLYFSVKGWDFVVVVFVIQVIAVTTVVNELDVQFEGSCRSRAATRQALGVDGERRLLGLVGLGNW